MIGRWYSQLAAYDLDITYVSGKSQVTADPLSRLMKARLTVIPAPADHAGHATAKALSHQSDRKGNNAWRGVSDVQGCWIQAMPAGLKGLSDSRWKEVQSMVINQVNESKLARNIPRSVWASHQRADQVLGPIFHHLTATGKTAKQAPPALRAVSQSYQVKNGVLLYRSPKHLGVQPLSDGWVVAVPRSLQLRVIEECHGDGMHGHRGVMKTVYAIRQRYFFRKMRSLVTAYINKCESCIRAKSYVDASDLPFEPMIASKPFAAISVDLYSPGEVLEGGWKYIMTTVDLCTRWVQFVPLRTKLPAEVMVCLCRTWFHFHGIPEFILSDRGKEFMGVMSTVCSLLGIKQIRTTPYHPQTNGLCEIQHKSLTHELRIRSQRKTSPTWLDLVTEIQFSLNITKADEEPHLSPFELVFGRMPRLSSADVAFPAESVVRSATYKELQQYQERQVRQLQHLRFLSAEQQLERKETNKSKHDRRRKPAQKEKLKRGMLVHIQKPTRNMRKLMYQWTAPEYLIQSVSSSTCNLKPLVSTAGREGKTPDVVTVNQSRIKMQGKPPCGFWIGCRVLKKFGDVEYMGTVDEVIKDEGKTYYHVVYADFDEEELDMGELWDHVIYHPELDAAKDGLQQLGLPDEGSYVLFAADYAPRIGRVVEKRPTQAKQLVVQMWRPKQPRSGKADLTTARYETRDSAEEPDRRSISMAQVKVMNLHLNEDQCLDPQSQIPVRKALKWWRRR